MNSPRHLLEEALRARVRLLATTLRPATVNLYQSTLRHFLAYLRQHFPNLRRPDQLRRDPHLLGWLESLAAYRIPSSGQALSPSSRAGHVIRLRHLLDLLADHAFPPSPGLLAPEDVPRAPQFLPRALTPEDDARLQAELRRPNDLLASALLVTRLTGLRIGETADLAADCLKHLGGDQWALHVPLGKLHTERWTPVDPECRTLIARLQFLRTLPPVAPPEFLLPRPKGRAVLCCQLRAALAAAARQAGIASHVVPHQLRHTYATSMLRAGVSLPGLMQLLGHRTADMTLRYVQVTQQDLQREFQQAQNHPRHCLPRPALLSLPDDHTAADPDSVLARLSASIRVLDLYRQRHSGSADKTLQLLHRRLVRIRSAFQKLIPPTPTEK